MIMETLLVLFFVLILAAIGSLPSLLFWWLAWKLLPKTYSLPPYRMTLLCIALSFLTGMVLNPELEGGGLSIMPFMLVLTLLWSFILLPASILVKYFFGKSKSKTQ